MKTIFKAGDKVFDARYGWGIIKEINDDLLYPVTVTFSSRELASYTLDGKYITTAFLPITTAFLPMLSFTEYDYVKGGFSQERPIVLPEKGDLIWVKNIGNGTWDARYYSHTDDNGKSMCCFCNQTASGVVSSWVVWQIKCPLSLKIKI
jgi:hypothetical protein